jgi:hypothetical protein
MHKDVRNNDVNKIYIRRIRGGKSTLKIAAGRTL